MEHAGLVPISLQRQTISNGKRTKMTTTNSNNEGESRILFDESNPGTHVTSEGTNTIPPAGESWSEYIPTPGTDVKQLFKKKLSEGPCNPNDLATWTLSCAMSLETELAAALNSNRRQNERIKELEKLEQHLKDNPPPSVKEWRKLADENYLLSLQNAKIREALENARQYIESNATTPVHGILGYYDAVLSLPTITDGDTLK